MNYLDNQSFILAVHFNILYYWKLMRIIKLLKY